MSAGKLITTLKPDRKAIWQSVGICFGIAILTAVLSIIQSFWLTKEISLFYIPRNNVFHENTAIVILTIFAMSTGLGLVMAGMLIASLKGYYDIYIYENGFEYQNYGFYTWPEVVFDLKIPSHENAYFPCCCFTPSSGKPGFFSPTQYESIDYNNRKWWNAESEALYDYLNEQKNKYERIHNF